MNEQDEDNSIFAVILILVLLLAVLNLMSGCAPKARPVKPSHVEDSAKVSGQEVGE